MMKSIALMMASSIFISSSMAAPAAPAAAPAPSPAVDPLKMLQQSITQIGKDAEHPYIIPYCGGAPINISTVNAGFLPTSDDSGTVSLPENIEVMMVDIPKPIDLTPYDNTLGALVLDIQFPADHPEWVNELNITGLMFTSNSSAPFDPTRLNSGSNDKITLSMAFSFMTTFDADGNKGEAGSDEGPVYALITSPHVKVPILDEASMSQAMIAPSLEQSGKFLSEMGFLMVKGKDVQVQEVMFSDMILMCLPAPTVDELDTQGITYWKKETAPGVFEMSPAMIAATEAY